MRPVLFHRYYQPLLNVIQGVHWVYSGVHCLLLHPCLRDAVCLKIAPIVQEMATKSGVLGICCQFSRHCLYMHHFWHFMHSVQGQLGHRFGFEMLLQGYSGYNQSNQLWCDQSSLSCPQYACLLTSYSFGMCLRYHNCSRTPISVMECTNEKQN